MSTNNNHTTPDAPQDWERFAQALQKHGSVEPVAGLNERLQDGWEDKLVQRQLTRQHRRRIGSLTGVATLACLLALLLPKPVANVEPPQEVALPPVAAEPPDIFANPEMPPIWFDTTLPEFELPPFPDVMEPGYSGAFSNGGFSYTDSTFFQMEEPVAGE